MASTLKDIQIDYLGAKLTGELITFDDPGYDDARTVFFKGVDRHPLAVSRVADAEDVSRVVSFAREGGVELAVRSGGHSRAGHGTSEGGIVIDLSGMKGLEVDGTAAPPGSRPASRRASTRLPRASAASLRAWATRALSASAGSRSPAASASWSARTG